MNLYSNAAADRNDYLGKRALTHVDQDRLSLGGREVYRRVRRSAPVCNLIAEIADLGERDRGR